MTANLTFREVSEWLSLVADNPKYANQDWNLDELFQRDVDYSRVRRMVVQYLNPSLQRTQFFNSITVILLPDEEKEKTYVCPPAQDERYQAEIKIGPILVRTDCTGIPTAKSFATLSWNRDQIFAVAIDGQHRLAAIKSFCHQHKAKSTDSTVSVIFIVVDKALGFSGDGKLDRIKTMRSLFIDLNKHAVPVSRVRNLLLDDRDPTARFVRSLFGQRLQFVVTEKKGPLGLPTGDAGEFDKLLPLTMVDWHGDSKSKIDTGPYVASILSLDWAVERVLNAKGIRRKRLESSMNPDDENAYAAYRNKLSTWNVWKEPNLGLEARLKEAESSARGFQLSIEDVDALAKEFAGMWGRPMTRLLTCLPGYADVVSLRNKSQTLTPQFSQWYQAKSQADSNKGTAVKTQYEEKLQQVLEELQSHGVKLSDYESCVQNIDSLKKNNILFFLVGQRATINALVELCGMQMAAHWMTNLAWDPSDYKLCPQDFYAKLLTDAFNGICDKPNGDEIFKTTAQVAKAKRPPKVKNYTRHFWSGSLMDPTSDPQIAYTNVAVERGTVVMLLLCFAYWFVTKNIKSISREGVETLIDNVLGPEYAPGNLPFEKEFADFIIKFCGTSDGDGQGTPMGFLANSGEGWDGETVRLLGKERIIKVISIFFPAT